MPIQSQSYDMDTDVSSDESYDSDQIDSDIEAELYSTIHHEIVSTKHEDNNDLNQYSSINNSNKESIVEEIEPPSFKKLNMNFGFSSFLNKKDDKIRENVSLKRKSSLIGNVLDNTQVQTESSSKKQSFINNSIEESIVEEIEPQSFKKFNMNFGFSSFLNKKDNNIRENENVSLKRKSSLIGNALDNIQVQTKSSSKKQKTGKVVKGTRHFTNSNLNDTIVISDSDSSVVFSEPDEVNIQTNIETCVLSSDSDCSLTFLNESSVDFYQSRNNWSGNYKDVWKINDTDLYRTNRRSTGRYHENALANCTNCNKKGHTAKHCTECKVLKCIICGGMHLHSECNLKICGKCLRFGHDSRNCFFPVHYMLCKICNIRGHGYKCCPDLWRRYHLTTSGNHIVKGHSQHQTAPAYCYNCGLQGHYGFNCNKCRMDRWSYPTWSSVISYEHPEEFVGSQQRDMTIERNISATNSYSQPPIPNHCVKISKLEEIRISRKEKKRLKKLKKEQRAKARNNIAQNECIQQQFEVSSHSNFECESVHVQEVGNFKRTPKVNQSQCVRIPKQMKTPKCSRKLNRKKKALRRKQLLAMKKQIAN